MIASLLALLLAGGPTVDGISLAATNIAILPNGDRLLVVEVTNGSATPTSVSLATYNIVGWAAGRSEMLGGRQCDDACPGAAQLALAPKTSGLLAFPIDRRSERIQASLFLRIGHGRSVQTEFTAEVTAAQPDMHGVVAPR